MTYRLYRNRKLIRVDGEGLYGYSYWSVLTDTGIPLWRVGQWENGAKDGERISLLECVLLIPEAA